MKVEEQVKMNVQKGQDGSSHHMHMVAWCVYVWNMQFRRYKWHAE